LYKINKVGLLKEIFIRGTFLSRKFLKKNKKNTLVYLRSPKHFNIGKFKIYSHKTNFVKSTLLNVKIPIIILKKYPLYFFQILGKLEKLNFLKRINSLKVVVESTVKWK